MLRSRRLAATCGDVSARSSISRDSFNLVAEARSSSRQKPGWHISSVVPSGSCSISRKSPVSSRYPVSAKPAKWSVVRAPASRNLRCKPLRWVRIKRAAKLLVSPKSKGLRTHRIPKSRTRRATAEATGGSMWVCLWVSKWLGVMPAARIFFTCADSSP